MPLYRYACDCGYEMEDICPYSEKQREMKCEQCGKMAKESFQRKHVTNAENPRVSRAMGVHPSQIEAAMKRFPGSRYNKKGQLLIQNRTEKKIRMKQRNYIEY